MIGRYLLAVYFVGSVCLLAFACLAAAQGHWLAAAVAGGPYAVLAAVGGFLLLVESVGLLLALAYTTLAAAGVTVGYVAGRGW